MMTFAEASRHPEPLDRAENAEPSGPRPAAPPESTIERRLEGASPGDVVGGDVDALSVPAAIQDPIRLLKRCLSQLSSSRDVSIARGEEPDENQVAGPPTDPSTAGGATAAEARSSSSAMTTGTSLLATTTSRTTQGRGRRRRRPLSARQLDDVLRVADFWFGTHPCASTSAPSDVAVPRRGPAHQGDPHHHRAAALGGLLDGALALLDASSISRGGCGDAASGDDKGSMSSPSSLLTRVVSLASRRSLYLVKGSSATHKRRRPTNPPSADDDSPRYLCLLPDNDDDMDDTDNGDEASGHEEGPPGVYYCSCRSFHDRSMKQHQALPPSSSAATTGPTRAAPPPPATPTTTSTVLCKHLLALVLRPHLDVPFHVVEVDNDEEFGNYVLERIGM